jgi:predicted unusual protein kinase regulating ubiquinone biosynthesis (AarF/ABC1/UbiB family)
MDARAVGLADELGAQLGRLKGAGPKLKQFLKMVQLDAPPEDGGSRPALGALPERASPVPFGRVRRVISRTSTLASGSCSTTSTSSRSPSLRSATAMVHRARTSDGERVAVKVQHPGG